MPSFFIVIGLGTYGIGKMNYPSPLYSQLWYPEPYVVEFVIKPAGIAHRLPVVVPPPERGVGRLAVCADGALPPCG